VGPVVFTASRELDTTSLTPGAITLQASGGDGLFDDGNDVFLAPLQIEIRSSDPTVFAVSPPVPWTPDRYRLVISGDSSVPIRDRGSRALDGDRDGIAGGDLVLEFEVGAERSR
jgi:hypothetical protein